MWWWTVTYLNNDRAATTLTTLAETNHPAHLWMAWATWKPTMRPIYRTVRGKRVFCGYTYVWDTPNLTEQLQSLHTFEHTFKLNSLRSLDHIWYYLFSYREDWDRYCQGPLIHVPPMPPGKAAYYVYFASRLKGIYRTLTFSGPGTLQPYWTPDNEGLLSLSIRQAVLDPFTPQRRRYLIAGGHLYLHYNAIDFQPAIATTILTKPEALALTGSPDGNIVWVDPNAHHLGMLHVLWIAQTGSNGFWHLRSLDYGAHWTAHQINNEFYSYDAGNILSGIGKGTSPYPAGDVLYAAINFQLSSKPHVARSIDQGATWTTLNTPDIARGDFLPRLYIDPSNQSVVYLGSHPYFPKLYRSTDHGDSWTRIDRGLNFTITLDPQPYHADLRAHPSNPDLVRLVRRFWTARSDDFCESWQETENLTYPFHTHKFTDDNPSLLYMAGCRSAYPPPSAYGPSVIHISTDEGASTWPKAGAHASQDDGGGDSIPWNCGGAAHDGILIVT